jgi:hypothetical protein
VFQEPAAVTNFMEATLPDGGIIGNLPSSSSRPVTTLEDDMPNISSSAYMLDDVFVLPTYIRKASQRKSTNKNSARNGRMSNVPVLAKKT